MTTIPIVTSRKGAYASSRPMTATVRPASRSSASRMLAPIRIAHEADGEQEDGLEQGRIVQLVWDEVERERTDE
jgi:hypothetical protein